MQTEEKRCREMRNGNGCTHHKKMWLSEPDIFVDTSYVVVVGTIEAEETRGRICEEQEL